MLLSQKKSVRIHRKQHRVKRNFTPEAPNHLWVADITYLRTWEGWL
jgi:putative transposase